MAREISAIACEAADMAVDMAQRAGYQVKPERDLFFRSDISDLAVAIEVWLEGHMRLDADVP